MATSDPFVQELLTKWTNFCNFMLLSGPECFQGSESPIHTALKYPEASLAKYNLMVKEFRHNQPKLVQQLHEYSENFTLTTLEEKEKFAFFVGTVLFSSDFMEIPPERYQQYQKSLLQWCQPNTNKENTHKLIRYLCFFDMVTDHSKCCKFTTMPVGKATKPIKVPKTTRKPKVPKQPKQEQQ
jgi:hypothetical protein